MNKKLISMFLTFIFCMAFCINIYATGSIITSAIIASVTGEIGNMASDVLGYIQYIAWAIAIGMIIYVGIKYMMASANEKASLKSGTINLIIGALVIGATPTLFNMIIEIVNQSQT